MRMVYNGHFVSHWQAGKAPIDLNYADRGTSKLPPRPINLPQSSDTSVIPSVASEASDEITEQEQQAVPPPKPITTGERVAAKTSKTNSEPIRRQYKKKRGGRRERARKEALKRTNPRRFRP